MNKSNKLASWTDDLAAHWTDRVLAILNAAGVPNLSVDVELVAWHVLKKVLRSELRWQQTFQISTRISLSGLMDRVLRRAAEQILLRIRPDAVTSQFRSQIRRLVDDLRPTPVEQQLFARIVRQPELHAALKVLNWSDFTPRMHVTGAGL